MKFMKHAVVLIILDGWGIGPRNETNPIHVVGPKNFKWLEEHYPMTSLQASGISIGLPWNEVGNSEVGHLTLGAGRVIYQHYPRITIAIQDKSFFENKVLKDACAHAKEHNSALNLVGLLTKGHVHAAIEHLEALIELAGKEGVSQVKLHLFADGKDSPPKSVIKLLERLPQEKFATLIGRYYAMDREENWNLTEEAYNCLTRTGGTVVSGNLGEILEQTYKKGFLEESLPPLRFGGEEKNIQENDAVVFFNFREDSMRQLTEAFVEPDFDNFPRIQFKNLSLVTMTPYKKAFKVPVAFPPTDIPNPLGEVLSDNGMTQIRIAETHKYAHITYFFNSYREEPFKNEYRVLIPSEQTPHPATHPAMMAPAITDRLTEAMREGAFDFILVNYANADTMAHTGNYEAALEAVRIIDEEIGRVLKTMEGLDITLIITADHGNIEEMINPETGRMETQHDPSPVPLYLVGKKYKARKFSNWEILEQETIGILSDVAPTILEIMGLSKPREMDGKSLLRNIL